MSGTWFRTAVLFSAIVAAAPLVGCGGDEQITFDDPATITVRNLTNGKILRVFFKDCGAAFWGSDRLPDDPIEGVINVGASKSFTVEAGCYDLQAHHFSGPNVEPDPIPTVTRLGVLLNGGETFVWDVEPEGVLDPA